MRRLTECFLLATIASMSTICSAQQAGAADPEAVLRSYWGSATPEWSASTVEFERQIRQLHLDAHTTKDAAAAERNAGVVRTQSGFVTGRADEYSRVSCSEKICEVVLSYAVPSTGRDADSIVASFNATVRSRADTFHIVGPTVVTAGSTNGTGLVILTYVSLV